MVDTWNEDNKFNPPARMTIHARDKHLTNMQRQGTPQTPAMGEHIWHTLRDAIKFNTSETHPVLTSALGACCVVVRNVDLWAPPPSRRRRCSRPTDGDDARSLRIQQQRRQLRGGLRERLAKLHKMYGHGTGADTMEEQGPKAPWFHRGPDRQPSVNATHTSRRRAHAPPRAAHPSIAEVLVEHLGALRKDTAAPDRSLTRAWVRQRASTQGLRRNGRGPLHQWTALTRDAAARDRGTQPCSALGRDVSPAQGDDPATCTVLLLPYTSADKGATPEYVQWARTAPHVITHIATLSGADPHADSDVLWARETHRTTPHAPH
jgi:hypothetical protein